MKDYLEDYFKSSDSEKLLKSAILCKSDEQLQHEYQVELLKDASARIEQVKSFELDAAAKKMTFKFTSGAADKEVTIGEDEYKNNMDLYMIAANWFVNIVNPCGGLNRDRDFLKSLAETMKMDKMEN